MVQSGSSPGDQAFRLGPMVLPPIATAATTAITVSLVAGEARLVAAWIGLGLTAVATLVAAGLSRRRAQHALIRVRTEAAAREEGRLAEVRQDLQHLQAAILDLGNRLLPEAVARLTQGEVAEDVLAGIEYSGSTPEVRDAQAAVLRAVVEAVQREHDLRDSAARGHVNIARRVQSLVYPLLQRLRTMEDAFGKQPEVFEALLEIDRGISQITHTADTLAVLGGDRPGQQWDQPVPLWSVLRGALSRIPNSHRLDLKKVDPIAVEGPAVTPVAHAVAALLDNGVRYSPPKTKVIVTTHEGQNGVSVEIEDRGLGLNEEMARRVEQTLEAARAGTDLTELGEAPRLGLPAVGRLAETYGFTVALRPSAYGGVRAVLNIPLNLLTTQPADGTAHGIGAAAGPRSTRQAGPDIRSTPSAAQQKPVTGPVEAEEPQLTPDGLPQRRRRSSAPPLVRDSARDASSSSEPERPSRPGAWIESFQEGLRRSAAGTVAGSAPTNEGDES